MTHEAEKTVVLEEELRGIVQRVTYHNQENGWSVLRVSPLKERGELVTVVVHQTRVFAGATMAFYGSWGEHPQYGRQFRASRAVEHKPATTAALEKYLGSGLIKGVGPKTAKKIVAHFKGQTLAVFEKDICRLKEVEGIAEKKLEQIAESWQEHRAIRDVMMFLQGHGISTLFAVRIYKLYGSRAIELVTADPYRLAIDFFGIGFFSSDRVALSLGLARDSEKRLQAAIRHVLGAAREQGHCFLTGEQIAAEVGELLELEVAESLPPLLIQMVKENLLQVRGLDVNGRLAHCYYGKTLFYDETYVAERLLTLAGEVAVDRVQLESWLEAYCGRQGVRLSKEQAAAVKAVVACRFSILTGGPGCGKTTTTKAIVALLETMGKRVLLAAPTGRAAQRMGEVIGREAKTIHRLLEWQGGEFQKNEEQPLKGDFLIVDECSMLDISLSAALLRALPPTSQLLFIGDGDQLPSVGPGNVLADLLSSGKLPCFRLTKIFRQAEQSQIIVHAHSINRGALPRIESPFHRPEIWQQDCDCLFLDAEEVTREQQDFVRRIRRALSQQVLDEVTQNLDGYLFQTDESPTSAYEHPLVIPEKFRHVDLQRLAGAPEGAPQLKELLARVHPWSSLNYGLTAREVVVRLWMEWIPKYLGRVEIQVLSPMTRGSLGTAALNQLLQQEVNPPTEGKAELVLGERIFRVGDRVIHRRNNYELGVFNGDIGVIEVIDLENLGCTVSFFPDQRRVIYQRDDVFELDLAYAITIHKSQGSEFPVVIIPVLTQHFKMLYRNLLYTGLTRARQLAIFVGSRKAMAMAVRNQDTARRQTALVQLLAGSR